MDFETTVRNLKKVLSRKQPKVFSSTWIFTEIPSVYFYAQKNLRTENDDIDWDRITYRLGRRFQKRWIRYRRKIGKQYENKEEVDLILSKYKEKLYALITPTNPREELLQNRIFVALVRVSQKGNILAQQEVVKWTRFIIDDWVERYWQVKKWKGYTDDLEEKVQGCIRCYKYTGSFLGYLFKTLQYSSLGLAPLCKYSLDERVLDGDESRANYLIHDQQTLL